MLSRFHVLPSPIPEMARQDCPAPLLGRGAEVQLSEPVGRCAGPGQGLQAAEPPRAFRRPELRGQGLLPMPREPVRDSCDLHPQGCRGQLPGHPLPSRESLGLREAFVLWGAGRLLGLCSGVLFCPPASIGALPSLPSLWGGEGNRGLSSGLRTQPRCSWLNNCSAQPAYVDFAVWVGGALSGPAAGLFAPLRFRGPIPAVNTFTCIPTPWREPERSGPRIEPGCIMSPG